MINFYRDRMTAKPEVQQQVFSKLIALTKDRKLLWRQDIGYFGIEIYFALSEEFQVFLKMNLRIDKEGPPHVLIQKINSLQTNEDNEAILLDRGMLQNDSIGLFVAIRDQLETRGSVNEENFLKAIEFAISKTKNNMREEEFLKEFLETL